MEWYYYSGGRQHGPVQENEFWRLAQSGDLSPEDLVWNPSMGEHWAPASTIEGLIVMPLEIPNPSVIPCSLISGTPGSPLIPNKELLRMARESLRGKWGLAIGVTLLWVVIWIAMSFIQKAPLLIATHGQIAMALSPKTILPLSYRMSSFGILILQLLMCGVFTVGFSSFNLNLVRALSPKLSDSFYGFRIFWKSLFAQFLVGLFSLLWIILFQLPVFAVIGIMNHQFKNSPFTTSVIILLTLICIVTAASFIYSYTMTFFVLADDHKTGPLQAIQKSKTMMKGHKLKLLRLQLRFLGWFLLALLTLGIGNLWVGVYYRAALAHFYDDLRSKFS